MENQIIEFRAGSKKSAISPQGADETISEALTRAGFNPSSVVLIHRGQRIHSLDIPIGNMLKERGILPLLVLPKPGFNSSDSCPHSLPVPEISNRTTSAFPEEKNTIKVSDVHGPVDMVKLRLGIGETVYFLCLIHYNRTKFSIEVMDGDSTIKNLRDMMAGCIRTNAFDIINGGTVLAHEDDRTLHSLKSKNFMIRHTASFWEIEESLASLRRVVSDSIEVSNRAKSALKQASTGSRKRIELLASRDELLVLRESLVAFTERSLPESRFTDLNIKNTVQLVNDTFASIESFIRG
jgi:hypothetical protein